jgi:hypothetical protein
VSRPEPEEKLVEKVTVNPVTRRKMPLSKRFFRTFFGADGRTVIDFVMHDVFLPAAKDTLLDMVVQGMERAMFGTVRTASRRTGWGSSSSGLAGYTNYTKFSKPASPSRREVPGREISHRGRSQHDFDEIILATRAEGEEVLRRMYMLLEQYGQVTVADLYDIVGISEQFTDNKWGWGDLQGSSVVRIRSGYVLDLPPTSPIS